jgi:hypothetical protein
MTKVSFMTGYTSNVYHGLLLWSSADTPSNHLPFSFSEAEPIRMEDHKSRHLILQLILTQAWLGILIFGSDFWDPHWEWNSNSNFDSDDSGQIFF